MQRKLHVRYVSEWLWMYALMVFYGLVKFGKKYIFFNVTGRVIYDMR